MNVHFEPSFRYFVPRRVFSTPPTVPQSCRNMALSARAARVTDQPVKGPIASMTDPKVHYLVREAQNRLEAAVKAEEVRPTALTASCTAATTSLGQRLSLSLHVPLRSVMFDDGQRSGQQAREFAKLVHHSQTQASQARWCCSAGPRASTGWLDVQ